METGGDYCGIIQISAECFTIDAKGDKGGGERLPNTFDAYIKPPNNAVWSKFATNIHGLHENHESILSAVRIEVVWRKFIKFLDDNIPAGHRGILVAWNGATCDMECLYRYTNRYSSKISFPKVLKYFMDPLEIIRRHPGCKFHPNKSKLESLSLGDVYRYMHDKDLVGAHNSLIDAKA